MNWSRNARHGQGHAAGPSHGPRSGDGRNIIAAAKRGARAIGVEYNPDMVELSERRAREARVAGKATFVQGDIHEADVSKATVLALFLLPQNLDKLKDKFLAMKPGTRIVLNTFAVTGWQADETERITGECSSWCTSMFVIVPAQVAGTWRFRDGDLTLSQEYQMVSGTLKAEHFLRGGAAQIAREADGGWSTRKDICYSAGNLLRLLNELSPEELFPSAVGIVEAAAADENDKLCVKKMLEEFASALAPLR